jgi:hypothetical protein
LIFLVLLSSTNGRGLREKGEKEIEITKGIKKKKKGDEELRYKINHSC